MRLQLNKNRKVTGLQNKYQTKSVQLDFARYGNYHIDILRANGEIAISRKIQGNGTYMLSIPAIASGTYFVRVASSEQTKTKKIKVIK